MKLYLNTYLISMIVGLIAQNEKINEQEKKELNLKKQKYIINEK